MGLYLSVIAMIWRLCDFITSVCVSTYAKDEDRDKLV